MAERLIPSKVQIQQAEAARAEGHYEQAKRAIGNIKEIRLVDFSKRPLEEQKRFLAAARISTSSSLSLAKEQFDPSNAVEYLAQARSEIVDIYNHSQVQKAAGKIKTGINDEPYEYSTEMRRDKIAYTLTLFHLTGNPALLDAAIFEMDATIALATEPTIKTLLEFEKACLLYRESNFDDDAFDNLAHSFDKATKSSLQAKNWKRAATITARFMVDIEAKQTTIPKALYVTYDQAVRHVPITDGQEDIFSREKVKAKVEQVRHRSWRINAQEDYLHLALPAN